MTPYGVTRPQRVKSSHEKDTMIHSTNETANIMVWKEITEIQPGAPFTNMV